MRVKGGDRRRGEGGEGREEIGEGGEREGGERGEREGGERGEREGGEGGDIYPPLSSPSPPFTPLPSFSFLRSSLDTQTKSVRSCFLPLVAVSSVVVTLFSSGTSWVCPLPSLLHLPKPHPSQNLSDCSRHLLGNKSPPQLVMTPSICRPSRQLVLGPVSPVISPTSRPLNFCCLIFHSRFQTGCQCCAAFAIQEQACVECG